MKIQALRKKIDLLDSRLLKLLNQRAKLSAAIGQWKLASGGHVYAPEREEHLLRTLEKKNRGPMSSRALRAIYREILSTSRACQSPLKIACLGQDHSNTWVATRRRFGSSDHYWPMDSMQQVVSKLKRHLIDLGVVDSDSLVEFLWRNGKKKLPFAVCGDIILPLDGVKNGARQRDVYFLLSRQEVPASDYSKTVVILETATPFKSAKDWLSAFSLLKKHVLHVERIQSSNARAGTRWLVELKGHWEQKQLATTLEAAKAKVRRWQIVGSYPEVSHHA